MDWDTTKMCDDNKNSGQRGQSMPDFSYGTASQKQCWIYELTELFWSPKYIEELLKWKVIYGNGREEKGRIVYKRTLGVGMHKQRFKKENNCLSTLQF